MHLRVFPARSDGFHPLRSWFRTIDLFDELTFATDPERAMGSAQASASEAQAPTRLVLTCDAAGVPTDNTNLVCRAWNGEPTAPPAWATLVKRIPVGSGLGGGSSDAAATIGAMLMLGVFEHLSAPAMKDATTRLAESLGSDVPFFLHRQLDGITDATCTGRGEVVTPFVSGRRHAVLLLLPPLHVSTPGVYRQFDAMPQPPDDGEPNFDAWSRLSATELLPMLRNDLEPPAFALHPQLAALRDGVEAALGRPVRMSGSGSTLFTLYDDADGARAALATARSLVPSRLA